MKGDGRGLVAIIGKVVEERGDVKGGDMRKEEIREERKCKNIEERGLCRKYMEYQYQG